MASKHQKSDKVVTSLESNESTIGPKVVETIAKSLTGQEGKFHNNADNARDTKSNTCANETIVEREIREQRERENALACERAVAALHITSVAKYQVLHGNNDLKNGTGKKNGNVEHQDMKMKSLIPPLGAHISNQLQKAPGHEEPRLQDDTNNFHKDEMETTGDSGHFCSQNEKEHSLKNVNNDFCFQCNTNQMWHPGTLQNAETSQFMADNDSSNSGQSSDSGMSPPQELHSTRNIIVKPLSEPDDDTANYIRWQKETPIEREIRLAREREEELRREKGLVPLPANNAVSTMRKSEVPRFANRRNTSLNDCRSVQHRIATSRIQQEINEATEREKELHAAGLIQTISEDTVDSKFTRFTDLAGYAIEETERKLRRAVSTSSVVGELESQSAPSPLHNGQKAPLFRSRIDSPNHSINYTPVSRKKVSPFVAHKGVMQRFLASHGRVNTLHVPIKANFPPSAAFSTAFTPTVSPKDFEPKTNSLENELVDDSSRKTPRRGYQSAEERIQAELQEMQKREEELRLQRAQVLAQSQPNLLSIGDFEDTDMVDMNENVTTLEDTNSDIHSKNSKHGDGEPSFTEV